jgi:hypothetical protein
VKKNNPNETLNSRIAELRCIQEQEIQNNFANGDLWNNCEDAIWCLGRFGQENFPKSTYNENGVKNGYELNDGRQVHFGWSIEVTY